MLFLVDEHVPPSLVEACEARGHGVVRAQDQLARGTEDVLVVDAADQQGAVVLTFDKDFSRFVTRRPDGNQWRWRRAGRVWLRVPYPHGARRLADALPLLECEAELLKPQNDARLIAEVTAAYITFER